MHQDAHGLEGQRRRQLRCRLRSRAVGYIGYRGIYRSAWAVFRQTPTSALRIA